MTRRRIVAVVGAFALAASVLPGCDGTSTGPTTEMHDSGPAEHLTVPAAGPDSPLAKSAPKKSS